MSDKKFNLNIGPQWAQLVEAVGSTVDKFITTKEEKSQAKQALLQELNRYHLEIQDQISTRHQADMNSDSWLSKNIRPLVLITSFTLVTIFAFTDGNVGGFTVKESYIDMINMVFTAAISFYFVGRTVEKWNAKREDRRLEEKRLEIYAKDGKITEKEAA